MVTFENSNWPHLPFVKQTNNYWNILYSLLYDGQYHYKNHHRRQGLHFWRYLHSLELGLYAIFSSIVGHEMVLWHQIKSTVFCASRIWPGWNTSFTLPTQWMHSMYIIDRVKGYLLRVTQTSSFRFACSLHAAFPLRAWIDCHFPVVPLSLLTLYQGFTVVCAKLGEKWNKLVSHF